MVKIGLTLLLIINVVHLIYTFHSYHALDTPDNVITHSVDQYKNEKVYTIGTEKHRSIILIRPDGVT